MNDFLQHIYFGNSLRLYGSVLLTILLTIIFKRYISKYLATILFKLVSRAGKTLSKKDFLEFQGDLKTKRAVERNIEIIGEAVARILKHDENFPIANARKIVDTRNRIIHGYDSVSEDIIWAIVVKELPHLEQEILTFLESD